VLAYGVLVAVAVVLDADALQVPLLEDAVLNEVLPIETSYAL
jgi:hypothetical protein